MISMHVKPLGDESPPQWVDAATTADCFGLVRLTRDGTNTSNTLYVSSALRKPTRTEQAFEYAVTHYDHLLRRLAD